MYKYIFPKMSSRFNSTLLAVAQLQFILAIVVYIFVYGLFYNMASTGVNHIYVNQIIITTYML